MRERVKSSVGARMPPFREHYGFFRSIVVTREEYFLKIKFTFYVKNLSPQSSPIVACRMSTSLILCEAGIFYCVVCADGTRRTRGLAATAGHRQRGGDR